MNKYVDNKNILNLTEGEVCNSALDKSVSSHLHIFTEQKTPWEAQRWSVYLQSSVAA